MFRNIRSTCILSARLFTLAIIFWSLTGCAAVVGSMAMIPIHMIADAIVQSTQIGIDTAVTSAHTVIDQAE